MLSSKVITELFSYFECSLLRVVKELQIDLSLSLSNDMTATSEGPSNYPPKVRQSDVSDKFQISNQNVAYVTFQKTLLKCEILTEKRPEAVSTNVTWTTATIGNDCLKFGDPLP